MAQHAFSTLFGGPYDRATERFRPYGDDASAKAARDSAYRALKMDGYKVRRWTLRGQLRQYWSFGVPCGEGCNVYMLDFTR